MVAVPYGKDHRDAGQALVFAAGIGAVFAQTGLEGAGRLAVRQPAGDVAASLHEVKIIELFQVVLLGGNRLDEGLFLVVAEQEDVGQLQRRAPADPHAGRDALDDGFFRRPDGRRGVGGIVVGLKVYHAHQPLPDRPVFQGALHIDKAAGIALEQVLRTVLRHRFADGGNLRRFVGAVQFGLGENQVEGGGGVPGIAADPLPIFGLGGELVAGNDRPFGQIVHLGEQDIGGEKAIVRHSVHVLSVGQVSANSISINWVPASINGPLPPSCSV